ncbi:MAG: sugar lactone lactonase YvrE [Halioglobus sp.]
MRLRYFLCGAAAILVLALAAHFITPGPIAPLAVKVTGVALAPENTYQLRLRPLGSADQPNPEAVAIDSAHRVYSGSEDGWIYRTSLKPKTVYTRRWAHPGGYPIGMDFSPSSEELWVANYPLGLQRISHQGDVVTVVTEFDNFPIGFADDVTVGSDNTVYFTDASRRFNPHTAAADEPFILWELLEGRPNGRVLAYQPDTGETSVVIESAYFPSGIALTKDESALLFVEITLNRIMRHWLSGPKAGNTEIFSQNLPGVPDDIYVREDGSVWVSLISTRDELLDKWIQPYPWVKNLLLRLPNAWLMPLQYPQPGGSVLLLDDSGRPRCQFHLVPATIPANIAFDEQNLYVGKLAGVAPGYAPIAQLSQCD